MTQFGHMLKECEDDFDMSYWWADKNGIIWRTLSFGLILPIFLPLCSRKLAKFGTISKWRQPVTKFVNSVSYANWWPNYASGAAPSVV